MTKYFTLNIPEELVDDLRKIAEKSKIPTTWSRISKDVLYGWVRMHKGRGNV